MEEEREEEDSGWRAGGLAGGYTSIEGRTVEVE